jgi:hypothetical protein
MPILTLSNQKSYAHLRNFCCKMESVKWFSYMEVKMRQFFLLIVLFVLILPVFAQETTVPDLTGLNVPQAAAALNDVGLRLGNVAPRPMTAADSATPNTVADQSYAPGDSVSIGVTVDIAVWSAANITLIYDDNDLTMINRTGGNINLGNISFNSADGTHRFTANNWRGSLEIGDCAQIWSISRNEPKDIDGCSENMYWRTTNDPAEHFWTQTAGVDNFVVVQDGIERATCPAAPPNSQDSPTTCEFFVVSSAQNAETTPYIYLAYTTDRFAVINNSDDAWMPLTPNLYNFNPRAQVGAPLNLGDSALYRDVPVVGDYHRLAPGQCLMFTISPLTNAEPPQPCNVLAQRDLSADVAFWTTQFEVDSTNVAGRSTCPAATPERLTLCILPRP